MEITTDRSLVQRGRIENVLASLTAKGTDMSRYRLEAIIFEYTRHNPSRRAAAISEIHTAYHFGTLDYYREEFAPKNSPEIGLLKGAWERSLVCVFPDGRLRKKQG